MDLTVAAPVGPGRLGLLEVYEYREGRTREEIPIHERRVGPAVGPPDDYVLPRIPQVVRSDRIHRLQLEARLVEHESNARCLDREQRRQEGEKSTPEHAPHSAAIRGDYRHPDDGEGGGEGVIAVDDYVGDARPRGFLRRRGFRRRCDNRLEEIEWRRGRTKKMRARERTIDSCCPHHSRRGSRYVFREGPTRAGREGEAAERVQEEGYYSKQFHVVSLEKRVYVEGAGRGGARRGPAQS